MRAIQIDMKIKILKLSLFLLALTTVFISCKDDESVSGSTFVEADRTEQQELDNTEILAYLDSHYYNSSFFETGSNHKYTDIIIEELVEENGVLEEVPDGHTLLMTAVETRTTTYLETDYEYYVLNINQGGGDSPKFTDFLRVKYEGSSINDEIGGEEDVFDSAITPADLNLQSNGSTVFGTIKAWQLVLPTFNASNSFDNEIDDNGNVTGNIIFNNSGLGIMFVPSGLAYFSGTTTGSSYDNLIFKFELLQFETVDHDNDGIPSYIEDLNDNLDVTDDNTDEDSFLNFIDTDDDGDDVLTIDELIIEEYIVDTNMGEPEPILAANEFERSRSENDGIITIKTVTIADANSDGTPDYLDENITTNYNETSN